MVCFFFFFFFVRYLLWGLYYFSKGYGSLGSTWQSARKGRVTNFSMIFFIITLLLQTKKHMITPQGIYMVNLRSFFCGIWNFSMRFLGQFLQWWASLSIRFQRSHRTGLERWKLWRSWAEDGDVPGENWCFRPGNPSLKGRMSYIGCLVISDVDQNPGILER